VEALDYDFNLSKLERVMPKPVACWGEAAYQDLFD